ncbi:MAG: hypothetical protein J5717_10610 [Lachnospiraceae bacterium]|nr:hypothetical protein [Lachnospiraceae bacterium]
MGENISSENETKKEKKIIVYSPIMELYALAEIPPNVPRNPIIKWYQTNMTYEEKYRFGHITYEEYCAWMYELMNAQQNGDAQGEGAGGAAPSADERGTFWHNDQAERTNISSNDYNDFLSQNNVDISNRSTVDFDKLASEVGSQASAPAPAPTPAEAAPPPAASEEVDVNEVLANVNKDIHGGDQMLTQEEIEALFAAANG